MRSSVAKRLLIALLLCGCGNSSSTSVCVPGAKRCIGAVLQICDPTGATFLETPCSTGCLGDVCPQCTPSATRCEGAFSLTCRADGGAWSQQACIAGCDPMNSLCRFSLCTAGEQRCSAGSLFTCRADGASYDSVACPYGCDSATRACKAQPCLPGSTSCNGEKLVVCGTDGASYSSQTLCPYGCNAAASLPVCLDPVCSLGETRCDPANAKQVQKCSTDRTAFVAGTLCPFNCVNGTCSSSPTCTTGEEACRQNVQYHVDEIDRCNANTWELGVNVCTTGSCIDVGGSPRQYGCGQCWAGRRSCNGADVLECPDATQPPVKLLTCASPDTCVIGECGEAVTLSDGALFPNYGLVAQALVDCWKRYGGVNTAARAMCAAIDTRALAFYFVSANVEDWVCTWAAAGDFVGGASDYTLARDLIGCGLFNNSEVKWKWTLIPVGTTDPVCVWYQPGTSFWSGETLIFDRCALY